MILIPDVYKRQEIYSASKIYVNGELLLSYGSLSEDHYRVHVQNALVSLPSGSVEIAVSYTHLDVYKRQEDILP